MDPKTKLVAAIQAAIDANPTAPTVGRLQDALEGVQAWRDNGDMYHFMHAEYSLQRAGRDDLVALLREARLEPEPEPEFVTMRPGDIGIKPWVAKLWHIQDMCLFVRPGLSRHDIAAAVKRWRHIRRAAEIAAGERLVGPAPGDTVPDGSEAAEFSRLIHMVYRTRIGGWLRSAAAARREERAWRYIIKHLGADDWRYISDAAMQGG